MNKHMAAIQSVQMPYPQGLIIFYIKSPGNATPITVLDEVGVNFPVRIDL